MRHNLMYPRGKRDFVMAPTQRPAAHELHLVQLLREFAIASERYVDLTSARNHMHRTDLHALDAIMSAQHAGRPHTASALGRELGLTPAAVTALVDRLEASGHAVRERDHHDRRRIHIVMTPKAKTDGARMFAPLAMRLVELVQEYSPDQIALLAEFLTRATAAVGATTFDHHTAAHGT